MGAIHGMKTFTDTDIEPHSAIAGAGRLSVNYPEDLVHAPLDWQRRGLQQSASGYGAKLTTSHKLSLNGKLYRVYSTCYSNAASHWVTVKGRKIFIH